MYPNEEKIMHEDPWSLTMDAWTTCRVASIHKRVVPRSTYSKARPFPIGGMPIVVEHFH